MVRVGHYLTAAFVAAALAAGCKPNLEGRPSTIEGGRVLAIRSAVAATPALAEVSLRPGSVVAVAYEALYVGSDGDLDPSGLGWALCNVRKPIADTGPISEDCLAPASRGLDQLEVATGLPDAGTDALPDAGADGAVVGGGATAKSRGYAIATVDFHDCGVFGPSPPDPIKGQPPARAADPDATGGYYQPVRVMYSLDGAEEYAVGETRLGCGLSTSTGATADVATEFKQRYHANLNPAIESLSTQVGANGAKTPVSGTLRVAPGDAVTFTAAWAACDAKASTDPTRQCTGSEPYVVFESLTQSLDDRREAMRLSWFSTHGAFDHDSTGRTEDESRSGATTSDNVWTAPADTGSVVIWVVLRDDRGGVDWREVHVDVER